MANRSYNGRRHTTTFAGIPKEVLATHKYSRLSGWDVKLLVDLVEQYNGFNNGDLCCAWSGSDAFKGMKHRGWRSKGTLHRSLKALLRYGFIEKTRQGGKHKPSLYALTWHPIDERPHPETKKHKLDVRPTKVASMAWKDEWGN